MIVDGIEIQEAPSDDRLVEVLMSSTGDGVKRYRLARWTSAGWIHEWTKKPLTQKVVGWREATQCSCIYDGCKTSPRA